MTHKDPSPRGGEANSYYHPNQAQQPWGGNQEQPESLPSPPNVPLPVNTNMTYAQAAFPQNAFPYPDDSPIHEQPPPVYIPSTPIKPEKSDKLSFKEAFLIEKPKWNDIWASVLFSLVSIGFLIVSGFAFSGYKHDKHDAKSDTISLNSNIIIIFGIIVLMAFMLSLMYFLTVRYATKLVIYITAFMQVVMGFVTSIIYFARHSYAAAVIFLLLTIFYVFCFFSWRKKIPFSVLMLQTVIDVSKKYGNSFVVSAAGGIVATIFSIYFAVTLVGIYAMYHPGGTACGKDGENCGKAKVAMLIIFITFAAFWITEVIKNIIHVTVSGVYGSWYFCSRKPSGFPKGATTGAFKRAITYSFGSISFGSLVVAIMQFFRQLCTLVQVGEQAEGNAVGAFLGRFLGCFIGLLEWLIEFINEYAFSYMALYGKAYIPAAKETWRMLKTRGVDCLINECIVNPVLTMGSIFVAYVCAFMAFLYMQIANPAYNSTGGYTPVVMAVAFLLGLQICNIFMVPIKSGISTFFVAMAFDPEILEHDYPELYQQMVVLHPKVTECVRASA